MHAITLTRNLIVDLATEADTSIAITAREAAIVEVLRADAGGLLYAGVSGFRDGEVVVVDVAARRVVATMRIGRLCGTSRSVQMAQRLTC